jgi:hypothetical protein
MIKQADAETRRAWIRLRQRRAVLLIGQTVLRVAFALLFLLLGDFPDIDSRSRSWDARPRFTKTWPTRLVLTRTTGWPRRRQLDAVGSAWMVGPGGMPKGELWIQSDGLVWMPKDRRDPSTTRGFLLLIVDLREIFLTRLGPRSTGLVVREREGAEVWLWVREDARELRSRLADGLDRAEQAARDQPHRRVP